MGYPAAYRKAAIKYGNQGGFQPGGSVRAFPRINAANSNPRLGRNLPPTRPSFGRKGLAGAPRAKAAAVKGWQLAVRRSALPLLGRAVPWIGVAALAYELLMPQHPGVEPWTPYPPGGGIGQPGGWIPHCGKFGPYVGYQPQPGYWSRDATGHNAITGQSITLEPTPNSFDTNRAFWYRRLTSPARYGLHSHYRRTLANVPVNLRTVDVQFMPEMAPQYVLAPIPSLAPMLDPLSVPATAPMSVPIPVPWFLQPGRAPNPWRVDQREAGYSDAPSTTPRIDPRVRPDAPTVPRNPGPPPKGTKEKKTPISTPAGAIAAGLNLATESKDVVEALYGALPARDRARWQREAFDRQKRAGEPYRPLSPQEKAKLLYQHFPSIDVEQAIWNVAVNQIEDAAFGRIGRLSGRAARRAGRSTGFQLGPAH